MALRNITVRGDEILAKKCKPVKLITPRIREACEDMVETMKAADGVGIAAPQIGIMKRFFIAMPHVDAEDEEKREKIYYMINPEITYREGTQESSEGCLSVPGYMGLVDRPMKIRIRATDLDGKDPDIAKDMMTAEEYADRLEELRELHADDDGGDSMEIWEGRK